MSMLMGMVGNSGRERNGELGGVMRWRIGKDDSLDQIMCLGISLFALSLLP
jgi:hypothetical protein